MQYLMLDGERVEATAENLFSDLTPGDTVTVQLYVENQSDSSISFELLMAAPVENQDEIPLIKDEKYHYFGSQIRINSVKNANTDVLRLVGNDRYLLTLDSELYIGEKKDLPPTSIDDKYDFLLISEKKLTNAISIPAGGNITLDIELQFVDNGISQNAYIGFGSADAFDENIENVAPPTLSRTLICYFAYEN